MNGVCVQTVGGMSCAYPLDGDYRCARAASHDIVEAPDEPDPVMLDELGRKYVKDDAVVRLVAAYRDARETADHAIGDDCRRDREGR